MTSEDDRLIAAATIEMLQHQAPLELVLRPSSAFALAALLQLALKHPGVPIQETSAQTARTFIDAVRSYFDEAPAVRELLRRGDAGADVPPADAECL